MAETHGYRIRHFKKGDEVQIIRLFKDVFKKEMNVEEWKWKYEGQGFRNRKSVVAANEKGTIIGHFGALPLRMWLKDEMITGYQGVDVMIAKEYRGALNRQTLYYEISRFFYQHMHSFAYAFVNRDHLKLGMILGFFEKITEVMDNVIQTRKYVLPLYSFEILDWDDHEIDTLWNKVHKNLGWSIVRDRAFLQWRYTMNPAHSYMLFGLKKRFSKGLLGWAVTKEQNNNELLLLDLIFKDDYLETLLKKTISMAYAHGKKTMVIWLNKKYTERLNSIGFKPFRRGTFIPNPVLTKVYETREARQNLYFTMGDADFL